MHNLLLFIAIAFIWQLVTATENATSYPILVPVSDEGWGNSRMRRSSPEHSLKLAENEHFVWSSASSEQPMYFPHLKARTNPSHGIRW